MFCSAAPRHTTNRLTVWKMSDCFIEYNIHVESLTLFHFLEYQKRLIPSVSLLYIYHFYAPETISHEHTASRHAL